MKKRPLTVIAVGAFIGALVGGIIEGSDYAVFLADLSRHHVDPFGFGDLATMAGLGAMGGGVGGICGALLGAFDGPETADDGKLVFRIAGGIVLAVMVVCAGCVASAAFGGPIVDITGGYSPAITGICGFAAGVAVGSKFGTYPALKGQ